MNDQIPEQVMGFPISSASYPDDRSLKNLLPDRNLDIQCYIPPSNAFSKFKHKPAGKLELATNRTNKTVERAESFAVRIREHVRLGPKISETVKGKLSLGAKILKVGGVTEVFKQNFSMKGGEKLLNASQCYLSTTAGPIAGLLFISTDKIAFRSERTMKISSPTGKMLRIHYKLSIPVEKIQRANKSTNVQMDKIVYTSYKI